MCSDHIDEQFQDELSSLLINFVLKGGDPYGSWRVYSQDGVDSDYEVLIIELSEKMEG